MTFDKLKFWKKEDIPDYPQPETHLQPQENEFASEQSAPFAPHAFEQRTTQSTEQQIQLISAKLDTIKAQLETVLQKLDAAAKPETERPYQQRWKNF